MSQSRPQPTLADYMAVAISPALIIVLVGSLAFFLLTIFYAGAFEQRMYWTTACFVFAAVLISRISIVEGAERASLFGLALGGAAGLAMMRFTTHPWWGWGVLGVIWWSASHLVWNCTLVDDDEDASGQGLLEAAGLEPTSSSALAHPTAAKTRMGTAGSAASATTRTQKIDSASPPAPPQPWVKRFFGWWQKSLSRGAPPGLTVVYFSLAALPIFGLGQHFVAPDDRQYAFKLMVRYVAAALGLLLTTSFLGLRRYLRQRRLEMPVEIAGIWLALGAGLALAILVVAMLIPRPQPEYAVSSATGWLRSPERQASQVAPLSGSTGQGDSAATSAANDQTSVDQQQEQSPQSSGAAPTEGRSREGGNQAGAIKGSQPPTGASPSGEKSTPGQQSANSPSPDRSGASSDRSAEKQPGQANQRSANQPANQPQQAQQASQQPDGKRDAGQQPAAQPQPSQSAQQPNGEQQQAQQAPQSTPDQQSRQAPDAQKTPAKQPSSPPTEQQSMSRTATTLAQKMHQPPSPTLPKLSMGEQIMALVKLVLYVLVALVGLYFLIRHWSHVRAFLVGLWRELLAIFRDLFGKRQDPAAAAAAAEQAARRRPFASFADPFASGAARSSTPNAVVQYSFTALEAWAAEHRLERVADETPLEFAHRVAAQHAYLADGVQELASLYARIAYARETLGADNLAGVERLWTSLRRAEQPLAAARPA